MSAHSCLPRVGAFLCLLVGVSGAGLAALTCSTPPLGWQGAGRTQTLPQPQAEVGPPAADSASDTGSSQGSGPGPGSDAGSDAGSGDGSPGDAADG